MIVVIQGTADGKELRAWQTLKMSSLSLFYYSQSPAMCLRMTGDLRMSVMLGSFRQSTTPPYPIHHPPAPGTQVRRPPGRAGKAPGRDLPVVAQVQPEAPLTRLRLSHQLVSPQPTSAAVRCLASCQLVLGCTRCHLAPSR